MSVVLIALTEFGDGNQNKEEEGKPITGLVDGSGEYTLVYEDNDGDKMLVGDVPWQWASYKLHGYDALITYLVLSNTWCPDHLF